MADDSYDKLRRFIIFGFLAVEEFQNLKVANNNQGDVVVGGVANVQCSDCDDRGLLVV
jgi:hypothetical protein